MIPGAPGRSNIGRFYDMPQQTSRYVVSGYTRDGVTNDALSGCVVRVYETATNILRGSTISDANGYWAVEISGDQTVALRAVAYLTAATDLMGTTVNTLLAVTAPSVPSSWVTAFSDTLTTNEPGWNDYTLRQLLDASQISGSGSNIRVTLVASSSQPFIIDALYIGHQSSGANFDGSQVQLLTGGSSTFSVAAGNTLVTDSAAFAYDETRGLIIAAHFDPSGFEATKYRSGVGAGTNYYKVPAVNEAATTTVSGYTVQTDRNYLVSKIEVM